MAAAERKWNGFEAEGLYEVFDMKRGAKEGEDVP